MEADPVVRAIQPLVEHPARAFGWRQVPGRAVEEVLPRVVDAGRLGPRERMAADEPSDVLIIEAGCTNALHHRLLGRPDIRDDAVAPHPERAHDCLTERADGTADEADA